MEELSQEQILDIARAIKLKPALSSNIAGMGYDEERQILKIVFKNKAGIGASYAYFNVEPQIWEELNNSASVGKALSESVIKNKEKYKYIKL